MTTEEQFAVEYAESLKLYYRAEGKFIHDPTPENMDAYQAATTVIIQLRTVLTDIAALDDHLDIARRNLDFIRSSSVNPQV